MSTHTHTHTHTHNSHSLLNDDCQRIKDWRWWRCWLPKNHGWLLKNHELKMVIAKESWIEVSPFHPERLDLCFPFLDQSIIEERVLFLIAIAVLCRVAYAALDITCRDLKMFIFCSHELHHGPLVVVVVLISIISMVWLLLHFLLLEKRAGFKKAWIFGILGILCKFWLFWAFCGNFGYFGNFVQILAILGILSENVNNWNNNEKNFRTERDTLK